MTDMPEPMNAARRYRVTLRRSCVQEQTVEFIADPSDFSGSEMQEAVAAGYAAPEGWVSEREETKIVSLDSQTIEWRQT